MQSVAKSLQAISLAVVFLLAAAPGGSFAKTPAGAQHSAVPPAPTAIAPEEVTARWEEVANLLLSFSEKLAFSPEIEKIKQSLPDISRQIDLDAAETEAIVGGQPPLAILEAQRALWQRRYLQVSNWLTLLTRRAVELRAWTDQSANWAAIRSELATGRVRCGACGGDGIFFPPARGARSGECNCAEGGRRPRARRQSRGDAERELINLVQELYALTRPLKRFNLYCLYLNPNIEFRNSKQI